MARAFFLCALSFSATGREMLVIVIDVKVKLLPAARSNGVQGGRARLLLCARMLESFELLAFKSSRRAQLDERIQPNALSNDG